MQALVGQRSKIKQALEEPRSEIMQALVGQRSEIMQALEEPR